MSKKPDTVLGVTRESHYADWYLEVIKQSDLAENAPVRGCMVIKPWGYAIWENIQKVLDKKFKDTGHVNAYFPLLIPVSFLEQEAKHVEGFAKECAVVTHRRLEAGPDGKLIPSGKLEEAFVIRPTSETIIGSMFSKWVKSYRDLPILINQWANVMRWEMRTRMFLRTSEFLWQEGHTVHATDKEALEETYRMLDVYESFAHDYMAMPVYKGEKTAGERFPGAVNTFTIEAMMQDKKALQAGTSHFLGQNFSRAQEIKYLSNNEKQEYAWTTSWGVSTRLIGGLIMTHSDDNGLVVPPRLAPVHVWIVPIYRNDQDKAQVLEYCEKLVKNCSEKKFFNQEIVFKIDTRDIGGADKYWQQYKKGVPISIEVGPRDIAQDAMMMARRDDPPKQKKSVSRAEFESKIGTWLEEIQNGIFKRAVDFRNKNTVEINDLKSFEKFFEGGDDEKASASGFALAHWNENSNFQAILDKYKVSIRCIPLDGKKENGKCIFSGSESSQRVIFAKSY